MKKEKDLSQEVYKEIVKNKLTLCVDTETSGLNFESDKIFLIQTYIPEIKETFLLSPDSPELLLEILCDDNMIKIFHHAMFDLRFLMKKFQIKPRRIACTKVAAKICHPHIEKNSLKNLLEIFLNINIDKSQQLSDWSSSLSEKQLNYAVNDVIYLEVLLTCLLRGVPEREREVTQKSFDYIPYRAYLDLLGVRDVFVY